MPQSIYNLTRPEIPKIPTGVDRPAYNLVSPGTVPMDEKGKEIKAADPERRKQFEQQMQEVQKRNEKEQKFRTAKEFGKELSQNLGFTPTGKRIAAIIAPYVVPDDELPDVVEQLVGGVKTAPPSKAREFVSIALDLPLTSIGLSRTVAGRLATKAPSLLKTPITDFIPAGVKRILDTPVGDIFRRAEKKIQAGKSVDELSSVERNAIERVKNAQIEAVEQARSEATISKREAIPYIEPKGVGSVKQIDNLTKDEMVEAIDYIRLKKPFDSKMEQGIGDLTEKFGITSKRLSDVANKFERLIEDTKTKDVSGKKVLEQGSETTGQMIDEALPKYGPPNINLSRIDAPDELKKQIFDWAKSSSNMIDQVAPRATFHEIREEAERIGIKNVEEFMKEFKTIFPADTDNKHALATVQALRNLAVTNEQEIRTLTQALKTAEDEDAANLIMQLYKAQADRDMLLNAYGVSGRTAGQMLSFRRMLAQSLQGTSFDKFKTLQNIVGKNFEPGTERYDVIIKMMKNLDPDDPNQITDVLKNIKKLSPLRSWDDFKKFNTAYWYNNILSGIPTQTINFLGSALFGGVEALVTRPLAILLDIPISAITKQPKHFTGKGLMGYYVGAIRGFNIGITRSINILKTGFDPEELANPSKWDGITGGQLPIGLEAPTRALKAADAFFKGIWDEARKYELAINRVYEPNKTIGKLLSDAEKLIRSGDKEIIEEGALWGKWVTFNEAPGKVTGAFLNLRENVPMMRVLTPFVNIASNMLKRGGVDYGPGGFIRTKNPQLAAQYARAAIGTGIMGMGYMLYKNGQITLSAPTDPANRDLFYQSGKQPYSLQIGEHYLPVRRIEPFALPFLIGAIVGKKIEDRQVREEEVTDLLWQSGGEIGNLLLNSSYLNTLGQFTEIFNGIGDTGNKFRDFTGRVAGGLIPYSSFLRGVTYMLDPELPQSGLDFKDQMMANLPLASEFVPKRISTLGDDVERQGGRARSVLPFVTTKNTNDSIYKELERIDRAIGFPKKTISETMFKDGKLQKVEKTLESKEYAEYLRLVGGSKKDRLEKLFSSPIYSIADDEGKLKLIDKVLENATEERAILDFRIEQLR